MNRRVVVVAAVALAAVVLSLVLLRTGGPATDDAGPAVPSTGAVPAAAPTDASEAALSTLLDRAPVGAIPDTAQALAAFAALFGDVPDVTVPAALPALDGRRLSGSGPARWVLAHWDSLTDAQRTAVAAAVFPAPGEPPRLRTAGAALATPQDEAAARWRPVVDRMAAQVGARLGRPPLPQPELHLVDRDKPAMAAWTLVLAEGEGFAPDGSATIGTTGGLADRCAMFLPPSLWRTGPDDATSTATLYHEIVHCYQGFAYPDVASFRAAHGWVIEGSAEFAALDLAGTAGMRNNWRPYLAEDAPLFRRNYSALGFWFHARWAGTDPWTVLGRIWSLGMDDADAYRAAGGETDALHDSWGSSRARQTPFGDAWQVHGVDVTGETPTRVPLAVAGGRVTVEPSDARVLTTTGDVGAQTVLRVTTSTPVRIHDTGSFEDVHVTAGDYCPSGSCRCPDGSALPGVAATPVTLPLLVGVTGGLSGATVTTDLVPLADWCRRVPPPRPTVPTVPPPTTGNGPTPARNPHARPPGPAPGSASSHGDPHLQTLDGYRYDFQAGGEFVLLTSTAGDLVVQARQEPVTDADGTTRLDVAVTTAVAARVGADRVTVTMTDGRPELRLDGDLSTPREPVALPGGGTVAPDGGGYRADWPDGSALRVLPMGSAGLAVLVAPVTDRRGALTGLLGPWTGAADVLTDRDGTAVTDPAASGRDPLYTKIADSWRVSSTESLFDYPAGRSTADYQRSDMPSAVPPALSDAATAAGSAACAAVTDPQLRADCVLDVAASGDPAYGDDYRDLQDDLVVTGSTIAVAPSLPIGGSTGPVTLQPGESRRFTVDDPTGAALFWAGTATADCASATPVFWRVTAPDGTETLQLPACSDAGRLAAGTPGRWTLDVTVDPSADTPGTASFRVLTAGDDRTWPVTLPDPPGTVDLAGVLSGPGAVDRWTFDGLAGDTVTATAAAGCDRSSPLTWALADPDGFVVSLRTGICDDLDPQVLTADGRWSIVVTQPETTTTQHPYAVSVGRS